MNEQEIIENLKEIDRQIDQVLGKECLAVFLCSNEKSVARTYLPVNWDRKMLAGIGVEVMMAFREKKIGKVLGVNFYTPEMIKTLDEPFQSQVLKNFREVKLGTILINIQTEGNA